MNVLITCHPDNLQQVRDIADKMPTTGIIELQLKTDSNIPKINPLLLSSAGLFLKNTFKK